MEKYTIEELKKAYIKLYWSECTEIFRDVNLQLAKRLGKEEYGEFVHNN